MKNLTRPEITVELKNMSLSYKNWDLKQLWEQKNMRNQAIHDFSVTFEPGYIYGFIGRNAAGKTSLLSVASGHRKSSSGTVTVNGEAVFENSNYARHINFVYPRDFSEEHARVKNYVKTATQYRPFFDDSYCTKLLEDFDINPRKRMKNLSKGQQSAVVAAIGLASRCPFTIFDEAYIGMDAVYRNLFYKEILEDRDRHPRTIVISTHLITEVEYLFDKVIMIHQGKNLNHNYDSSITMNLQDLFISLTEKGGK